MRGNWIPKLVVVEYVQHIKTKFAKPALVEPSFQYILVFLRFNGKYFQTSQFVNGKPVYKNNDGFYANFDNGWQFIDNNGVEPAMKEDSATFGYYPQNATDYYSSTINKYYRDQVICCVGNSNLCVQNLYCFV